MVSVRLRVIPVVVALGFAWMAPEPVHAVSTPSVPSTGAVAARTSVSKALRKLKVKGRAPSTGYSRSMFGSAWKDVDGNGCDTRNDVLQRDFTGEILAAGGCTVLGGEWTDPYSGVHFVFDHRPSEIDGDHVVALSDAWQKGAQQWSQAKRERFANDPLNVVMTTASLNRQKGDGDAATWLPPLKKYRCAYVARQIAVKRKYGVWVTRAERAAMRAVLAKPSCRNVGFPRPSARAA